MNRECMYCQAFFSCDGKKTGDYCLNFKPRDKESAEAYKNWRSGENGKEKK